MEPLFPVDLSHLLYGICVNIFIINRYISKSYTTSKNTIGRQYTERGQLQCQLLLVTTYYDVVRLFVLILHLANGHFGKILAFRLLKKPFLLSFARYPTATTQKEKSHPLDVVMRSYPASSRNKIWDTQGGFPLQSNFLNVRAQKSAGIKVAR